jgi:uncharacterized glyoxalase superfamily protein PhnB
MTPAKSNETKTKKNSASVKAFLDSVEDDTRRADAGSAELVGRFVGVSLQVEGIDATHATLVARGVRFSSPPELQPWGGSLANFEDPDGNVLTLFGGGPG